MKHEDDEPIELYEDESDRLQQQYRERALKKQTHKSKADKIARISKHPKYDRNASGIPASGESPTRFKVKYRDLKDLPFDEKIIHRLANEMMKWAANEDTLHLEDFPLKYNYSPFKFFKLAEKYDYFAQALDYARHTISSRLHHKLEYENLNINLGLKLLPLYHYGYKQWELEQRLAKEHNKPERIVITLPEWTVSDDVKAKADRREEE